MAIKRTLTVARPYLEDSKVVRWELEMEYEQGTEGKDDYYKSKKRAVINAVDKSLGPNGDEVVTNNFTAKAEGDWTRKDIEDLCPIAQWDAIFTSQYDSVITNPIKQPVPDDSYVIPS
jgi:hypothetical protein